MKIALIGSSPPPRGGTSVHVERLMSALSSSGIDVRLIDSRTKGSQGGKLRRRVSHLTWWLNYFRSARSDIVHIHLNNWVDRAFFTAAAGMRHEQVVLTIHSLREDLARIPSYPKALMSYVISKADFIIAIGDKVETKLRQDFGRQENLVSMSAFIPPRSDHPVELPVELMRFINHHDLIVAANASNMDFFRGEDIYGLDMLVELCAAIRTQLDAGFVYCLSNMNNDQYYQKMKSRIKELGIEDNFIFVFDDIEFWPILTKSQLFIRPTCTDSYGISVAEALSLGVPSIASDVCARPPGTLSFRSRDQDDLMAKVGSVLADYEIYKSKLNGINIASCVPDIIDTYRHLIAGTKK